MDSNELRTLLTPSGLELLDAVTAQGETDPVRQVTALRAAGHSPELVSVVLGQASLRRRARAKLGEFADRMLFTPSGLEQASRLRVAARHAGRYRAAGITRIAELGCGIGADTLAFAGAGADVLAVDADEVTAAIAGYNLAPFPSVTVEHARAEDTALDEVDGVYLDPARRTAGHSGTRRLTDPDDYAPSLSFAFDVGRRLPTGVKLGPGFDRALIPDDAEAQWVSVDGQLVEMGLWFGTLAREGVKRSALLLTADGAHELAAEHDAADPETRPLGGYLYEPDGAVIRARQIGTLAERIGAGTIDASIAYLSSDAAVSTPFAQGFRVLDTLPLDQRTIRQELARRRVGTLEIKKRGVDIDPAAFRTGLKLKGPEALSLILTRVSGVRTAIIAQRLGTGGRTA
ncbi:class I SAM-dependent methyltransferase [Mycetocola reblochoni]|uniref:THUMP-like domain-containing protein n=2 Tax=Mycetocola reblochoni TaxID=331618 RepID=A0A1R4I9Q6_9MICO|nr:class I SAM-dependent methyltransferase [Mycetocola reblochoni]RLP69194.1 SAM-dependent methyltransferase [Mycetocola reblochoni]SJN16552.1 hypothetical protein FM119_00575 [Mycetocola reblochoni REB411]